MTDTLASPTCDQVLVLVDVELHAAQTLGGVCVDVLHMLNFVEAFVHLQDTRSKSEVKQLERGKKKAAVKSAPQHQKQPLSEVVLFSTGIPLERRESRVLPFTKSHAR